jgi:AraC-like DNA-binding protein
MIASCDQLETLSSIGFKYDMIKDEKDRINAIYEFSVKNFKRPIQLDEIAGVANISPNSFAGILNQEPGKLILNFD